MEERYTTFSDEDKTKKGLKELKEALNLKQVKLLYRLMVKKAGPPQR